MTTMTKQGMMRLLAILLCAVLSILAVACTTSQITVALNVAALAVSVANSTVSGISMDAATKAQVTGYLGAVGTALTSAAKYMKSGTITAAQIAEISSSLTAAVVPVLPGGIPSNVKTALQAVASGVSSFLVLLESSQGTYSMAPAGRSSPTGTYKLRLTHKDKRIINDSLRLLRSK